MSFNKQEDNFYEAIGSGTPGDVRNFMKEEAMSSLWVWKFRLQESWDRSWSWSTDKCLTHSVIIASWSKKPVNNKKALAHSTDNGPQGEKRLKESVRRHLCQSLPALYFCTHQNVLRMVKTHGSSSSPSSQGVSVCVISIFGLFFTNAHWGSK